VLAWGSESGRMHLTEASPNIAIGRFDLQNGFQILYSSWEGILGAQDTGDALHGWNRPLVELQSLVIALHSAVVVLHLLGEGAWGVLGPLPSRAMLHGLPI
jgi:hypothetical protein